MQPKMVLEVDQEGGWCHLVLGIAAEFRGYRRDIDPLL